MKKFVACLSLLLFYYSAFSQTDPNEREDCNWFQIGQTALTSWENSLFKANISQPIGFRLEKCAGCAPDCGWNVTWTGTIMYGGPTDSNLQYHIANLGTITPAKDFYVVAWMKRQGIGNGTGMIEFSDDGKLILHNTGALHAGDTFNFSFTYKTQ